MNRQQLRRQDKTCRSGLRVVMLILTRREEKRKSQDAATA
jgi:hypothetical protein